MMIKKGAVTRGWSVLCEVVRGESQVFSRLLPLLLLLRFYPLVPFYHRRGGLAKSSRVNPKTQPPPLTAESVTSWFVRSFATFTTIMGNPSRPCPDAACCSCYWWALQYMLWSSSQPEFPVLTSAVTQHQRRRATRLLLDSGHPPTTTENLRRRRRRSRVGGLEKFLPAFSLYHCVPYLIMSNKFEFISCTYLPSRD